MYKYKVTVAVVVAGLSGSAFGVFIKVVSSNEAKHQGMMLRPTQASILSLTY